MANILNSCQSLFLGKSNVLNKHATCIFSKLLSVMVIAFDFDQTKSITSVVYCKLILHHREFR